MCDFRPRLSVVARAVNVRAQIVEPERIDRRVGRTRLEVRSFDDGNFAPRLQLRRRDVLPGFAPVARKLNQIRLGACPNG